MNIWNRNLHRDMTNGDSGYPRFPTRWGLVMALTCALLLASMASGASSSVLGGRNVAWAAPECFGLVDIVLVLDQSGSIGGNQSDLQDAAKALVNGLNLGDVSGTRIGITRISRNSASVHVMSGNALSLNAAIANLDEPEGGTNIVAGLAGGAAQFSSGLGDRPNVHRGAVAAHPVIGFWPIPLF